MPEITPNCPKCDVPMKRQTARTGQYAGKDFFGCANFPKCRKIVNIEESGDLSSAQIIKPKKLISSPQKWSDSFKRLGWIVEYSIVSALPSFALSYENLIPEKIQKLLSQIYILEKANRERIPTDESNLMSALLLKINQRGTSPLCTYGLEQAIIKKFKLDDLLVKFDDKGDLARVFKNKKLLSFKSLKNILMRRSKFSLDEELYHDALFDSEREFIFFTDWISRNISDEAPNWFIPQADLDSILSSYGLNQGGSRRIDFLFSHPNDTFAIELDGEEHQAAQNIDQERDDALATCNIDVIRISNREFDKGVGPQLDKVKDRCLNAMQHEDIPSNQISITNSIVAASNNAKFQFSIIKAIKYGWLHGDSWGIKVNNLDALSVSALVDLTEQIKAFDFMYGTNICPKKINLSCDQANFIIKPFDDMAVSLSESLDLNESVSNFIVSILNEETPLEAVIGESDDGSEDMIIRSTFLPVNSSAVNRFQGERPSIHNFHGDESLSLFDLNLTYFLKDIFRKSKFRDSQLTSILNTLRQIDTVVLLPTGAGKSFIYQLSGLLMPGITIVIDPIVSLMEDQVSGLQNYGIDKAISLHSSKDLNLKLERVSKGEFHFIFHAPERLQSISFREKLMTLSQSTMINLAVIDEAHCVSEWGHDFRPAYLNVSRNIRSFCADRNRMPPPILSLTGTASRSVLRDVLIDLGIDQDNEESVIRPESFDRNELNFYVALCEPTYAESLLKGALDNLPEKFSIPSTNFFAPAQENTFSGIVFVPHGRGNLGVNNTRDLVMDVTHEECNIYSGTNPFKNSGGDWESRKRLEVREFKENKISTLVSTKAYGMGIDKPNIRYTIHYGIPSSIESFYQEAGRAGRNRDIAHCGIIFSEFSEDRTNKLLDQSIDLEELRSRYKELSRAENDDVRNQLYFHLNSFTGAEKEIEHLQDAVNFINDFDSDRRVEINFGDIDSEKTLFRLTKIGALEDYAVEYGRRTYSLKITQFNLQSSKDILLKYVAVTAPGRQEEFKRQLNHITSDDTNQNIVDLAKSYINFIYDIIERSRRASLREMVSLARTGTSDKAIRRLILDYLQEGVGADEIEYLISQDSVSLSAWFEKLSLIDNTSDARELRGLVMRFRDSYPDHPGLLLLRSISEMLCSKSNQINAKTDLLSAINFSIQKYSISHSELSIILEQLLLFAAKKDESLGLVICCAFLESIYVNKLFDDVEKDLFPGSTRNDLLSKIAETNNQSSKIASIIYGVAYIQEETRALTTMLGETLRDSELISMIR